MGNGPQDRETPAAVLLLHPEANVVVCLRDVLLFEDGIGLVNKC